MRYRALACDYDGTLATHGVVDPDTIKGLQRWIGAGGKLLMVTGRELPELKTVCPELSLFDCVVAENGGLLHFPASGDTQPLANAPPPEFVERLVARGVQQISVGQTIVATWEPYEAAVFETIHELGLELQVIFNKGAVMVLPTGINKATGLAAALRSLELSRHGVVAIGDAENDHAFLRHSRYGVAVSNALEALKQRAEFVTTGDHGRGVQELIDRLLLHQMSDLRPLRHAIPLSENGDSSQHWFPGDEHLLLASDDPQATDAAVAVLVQALALHGYQFCWLRCEASAPSDGCQHLATHAPVINVGSREQLPTADEVIKNLLPPDHDVMATFCTGDSGEQRQRLREVCERLFEFQRERDRPHAIILPTLAACDLPATEVLRSSCCIVAPVGTSEASGLAQSRGRAVHLLPVTRATRLQAAVSPPP